MSDKIITGRGTEYLLKRRFNLLRKEDEEMKEKCIIDYTVTESAQKVSVNEQ